MSDPILIVDHDAAKRGGVRLALAPHSFDRNKAWSYESLGLSGISP